MADGFIMCYVLTRNGRSTFYEHGLITEPKRRATLRNATTQIIGKGKDKVRPGTGHESPQGEQSYSSNLSLTSALDGCGVNATHRPLYPRERPVTHFMGGWVGPRFGLDGYGKSGPHRDLIPGSSSP